MTLSDFARYCKATWEEIFSMHLPGSRFSYCLDFTLSWEGQGVEYDPNDPGGTTAWGIDQRDHPDINVRELTLSDAKQIYFDEKWLPFRCNDFVPPWDLLVFDSAVNPGQGKRDRNPYTWGLVNALQECCGSTVDGYIGPKTISAVNRSGTAEINCFVKKRLAYYNSLPASLHGRPFKSRFIRGWTARTEDLHRDALAT